MKNFSDLEQFRRLANTGQRWGCVTLAQHGDDLMLINLCELLGLETPSYLDLGAHHPFTLSNTALLYERGSRGVNIEANETLMAAFKLYRPEDKNICIGVGTVKGGMPFYMFGEQSGINSFSKDHAFVHLAHLEVRKTVVLDVMPINDIVRNYCEGKWPDILLSDIEGMDFEVLQAADFSKSKPRIIVVEVRRGDSAHFKSLLADRGYICYCRMGENLFFIQEADGYLVY